jgi:hypothetical protein
MKSLHEMTVSEVNALVPFCGPVDADTPPAVVTLLAPEPEEQLGMFSTCVDATIWVLGWTAAALGGYLALYWVAVLMIRHLLR